MGYESRVYIVNEWDDKFNFVDKEIGNVYNNIEYGEYWRTTALKDFLHSIIVNRDILSRDFESLKVYHYGY